MKFVGRVDEQERLRNALSKEDPVVVVVYGRRRIGKSALVRQVLSSEDVYYMADQTERPHQTEQLAKTIGQKIPGFERVLYPDWQTLFEALSYRTTKKFTLCLDEFPYLVKSSPELPATLQKLIDAKALNYHIVLCGSSQQLMQGSLLDAKSPLFGRANEIIKLPPLMPSYMRELLNCSAIHAVEEYAVWGGTPRYWEIRLQSRSLMQAIAQHIINPQGLLMDEPYRLLTDDMRDIVQASTILSFIGSGVNRISEIAARANKPATSLSGPLDKLISLGYIKREVPFNENPKNSKKGLYRISDPFLDFYFRFVIPDKSLIELGRTELVMEKVRKELNNHVARHWEHLCRMAVSGQVIKETRWGLASRWWGSLSRYELAELDVVAESTDGKKLLVGECKWADNENPEPLMEQLLVKAKKLPFAANKEIVPILFLKSSKKTNEFLLFPEHVLDMLH